MKRFHIFYFSFIIALLSSISGFGQRETVQIFEAETISELYIDADEVFKITIETAETDKIKLAVFSEGEYTQQIGIKAEQKENQLHIFSAYSEILTSGYDKLSAHKVYAVNLKLVIPENLKVIIVSNIASVYGKGKFIFFEAELKSGDCLLQNYQGKALINTFQGSVSVTTKKATVIAKTNHGSLFVDKSLKSGNLIEIKSINGDVEVKKIQ